MPKSYSDPMDAQHPFISMSFSSYQEADQTIIDWAANQSEFNKGFHVKRGSLDKEKGTKACIGRNLYCHRGKIGGTVVPLCPWKVNLRVHEILVNGENVKVWQCTSRYLVHTHELLNREQMAGSSLERPKKTKPALTTAVSASAVPFLHPLMPMPIPLSLSMTLTHPSNKIFQLSDDSILGSKISSDMSLDTHWNPENLDPSFFTINHPSDEVFDFGSDLFYPQQVDSTEECLGLVGYEILSDDLPLLSERAAALDQYFHT